MPQHQTLVVQCTYIRFVRTVDPSLYLLTKINLCCAYISGTPTTPEQAPDWEIVTRVSGPEPGYKATPIFIVQAALLLLDPLSKLKNTPGVYTPGALLGADLYVKRLKAAGIKFEELSSKAI